jgi:hypothetical protein
MILKFNYIIFRFYFPMFESDSFLYNLDTNSDNDEIT